VTRRYPGSIRRDAFVRKSSFCFLTVPEHLEKSHFESMLPVHSLYSRPSRSPWHYFPFSKTNRSTQLAKMNYSAIILAAGLAAVASAQDLTDLPSCGVSIPTVYLHGVLGLATDGFVDSPPD
jgi:hypothetical protein